MIPTENNLPIRFIDMDNNVYDGLFIQKENLFFIGFEESGDFLFSFQVKAWEKLSDEYIKSKGYDKLM